MERTLGVGRLLLSMGIPLAVVLAGVFPAQAFYWQNWPGSGLPNNRTASADPAAASVNLSLPFAPVIVTPRPTPTGSATSIGDPGSGGNDPGGSTPQTPEPSSFIIGLIGLGTLGLMRRARRTPKPALAH